MYIKFEEARDTLAKALASGDSMWMAECYYILGKRYMGLCNFVEARNNLLRSVTIQERYSSSEEITKAYMRLVECELFEKDKGDFEKAKQYAQKLLYHSQKANTQFGTMNAYRAMAGLHRQAFEMKEKGMSPTLTPYLDSAIFYCNKALHIAISTHKPLDIALSADLLGDTWSDLGKLEKGITYDMRAIQLYTDLGNIEATIEPAAQIGNRYVELGKHKLAIYWLNRSRRLADSTKWDNPQYRSYLARAYTNYYRAIGDPEKAISYQKEEYEQKLKGEESYRKAAIEGITISFENDRKQHQLEQQRKELDNGREKDRLQSWLIFLSTLLFVSAGVIAFLSYRHYKIYKAKSHKNENLFLEQSHRIKNNLQAISDLLKLQLGDLKEPGAIQALEESVLRVEAMAFIHKRLYGKNRSDEIDVKGYVHDLVESVLRSYNLGHVIVEYSVERISLHADKAVWLGLIVNELANNACKYALSKNPTPVLSVICNEKNHEIFFALQDSGGGFDAEAARESFGLELIQILVDNLAGKSLFTFEHGTRFTLTFGKGVKSEKGSQSEFKAVN